MADIINTYPPIIPIVDLNELYTEIIKELKSKKDLKSKYLYLGWHGAKAWKGVDGLYKISSEGLKILDKHFPTIDNLIRNSIDTNSYNIISLGTGTGEEDNTILNCIARKFKAGSSLSKFSYFPIDISIDLLKEGTKRIQQKINTVEKLKNAIENVTAINIDLEQLSMAKSIFKKKSPKNAKTNLFHLLGLTLSNNNETLMLKSIYNAMDIGDYLLLSVDFSYDDTEKLYQTKEQYHSQEINEPINQYLCSPLIFASKYSINKKTKHLQFSIDDFDDLEIYFNEETEISNVKDSLSFVYYYKFKSDGIEHSMRACFSHKYKSENFKKYLTEELTKQSINFQLMHEINEYTDNDSLQSLILLRKIKPSASNTKMGFKKQIIPNKEFNEFISSSEKIIKASVSTETAKNINSAIKNHIDTIKNKCKTEENYGNKIIESYNLSKNKYNSTIPTQLLELLNEITK